jgi:hypothetical protein
MKAASVPQELKDMLDAAAGKGHSREGSVMQTLAAILTRWEEIRDAASRAHYAEPSGAPKRVEADDILDRLHEEGKRRDRNVPEFDVEETLLLVRAVRDSTGTIFVTEAQAEAARMLVERDRALGRESDPAVLRIASAAGASDPPDEGTGWAKIKRRQARDADHLAAVASGIGEHGIANACYRLAGILRGQAEGLEK